MPKATVRSIFFSLAGAFTLGLFLYLFFAREEQPLVQPRSEIDNVDALLGVVSDSGWPESVAQESIPYTGGGQSIEGYLNDLQSLPNKKLINAITEFWRNCKIQNNCEAGLNFLKGMVDSDRFHIIKEYPKKISRFNESLQYEINSLDQQLEGKIEKIRAAYHEIWGEVAEELFFDELNFYEQHAQLNSLYMESQDLDLQGKVQAFDGWIKEQQFTDSSRLNPYAAAELFFNRELDEQPDSAFAITLAQTYLGQERAVEETQRLLRRKQQQKQTQNYQKALKELHHFMKVERAESYSNLSDSDWKKYEENRIREFKIQFFNDSAK